MKDLDTAGAPMISVPAGILKEFMSPANSRTPTPPMVTSTSSSSIVTTTPSEVATSNSLTESPAANMTNGIVKSRTLTPTSKSSSPAPMVTTKKSSCLTSSSASPVHMNGDLEVKDENNEEKKISQDHNLMNGNAASPIAHSPSSSSNDSGGVKRANDDEDSKPDLKKIRVLPSVNKDGFKNLNITVKEVSKALDFESKKCEEAEKRNQQNLVTLSRIKNGIAKLERLSTTDSLTPSPASISSPSTPTVQEEYAPTTTTTTPTPEITVQPTAQTTEVDTANKENVRASRRKESKLTKNILKDTILRVFSENSLYNAEVGHLKQMCEKLTSTLEINMRKVAQFHKEIEDLRKVTTRLSAEHDARKGQYVAPIRIKRSVGIQAAPHIINKGIMHANVSGGTIKTIAPRNSNVVLPSSMGQNLLPGSTLGFITTSSGIVKPGTLTGISGTAPVMPGSAGASLGTAVRTPSGQIMMMTPAPTMQSIARPAGATTAVVGATATAGTAAAAGLNPAPTMLPVASGRVVRGPLGNLGTVATHPGTVIGAQRSIILQNDNKGAAAAGIAGVPSTLQTALTPVGKTGGGVIDLTDEDEVKGANRSAMVTKPGTLVKVPTTATAQLVPLQGGGMGQVVLLPNTSGGQPTTALIVSQVSSGQTLEGIGNPAVAQARMGAVVSHTSSTLRLQGTPPQPAQIRTTTPTTTPPTTTPIHQQTNPQMKHPAPLPKTPFQQVGGISKKLPPQPTLKLNHKDSSIVLSWTMAKTEDHETIASYQLYAYQEGAAPPSANLWKKVGSVKALELPMACTLTQFMPGHVYHFAVRAVDTKSRLGPFSEPRSIRLDKK